MADTPQRNTPVSVIIPVRNEELNIADCLASVAWADQVFVVDSASTDATCQLATGLGAEVVQFHYDGGWPKKKNWALQNLPIRNDWILILDADERVTDALHAEIETGIRRDDIDGYYLHWKFVFLGRWMKHAWSHGWMLRLLRKGHGQYEDLGMRGEGGWDNEVHENILVDGPTACLQSHLLHESNQDLGFWLAKQNDFSTWNASRRIQQLAAGVPSISHAFSQDPLQRRKWLKAVYLRMPARPLLLFLYLYLFRCGFLDGREGLVFCLLRAGHELNTEVKMLERKKARQEPPWL